MSEKLAPDNNADQILLSGVLNFTTVPQINKQYSPLFALKKSITVNLQNITYSDSSGLALLAEWTRRARKNNKEIKYINIPRQMRTIAEVTGLALILPIK